MNILMHIHHVLYAIKTVAVILVKIRAAGSSKRIARLSCMLNLSPIFTVEKILLTKPIAETSLTLTDASATLHPKYKGRFNISIQGLEGEIWNHSPKEKAAENNKMHFTAN
jgi:hypothetical protein